MISGEVRLSVSRKGIVETVQGCGCHDWDWKTLIYRITPNPMTASSGGNLKERRAWRWSIWRRYAWRIGLGFFHMNEIPWDNLDRKRAQQRIYPEIRMWKATISATALHFWVSPSISGSSSIELIQDHNFSLTDTNIILIPTVGSHDSQQLCSTHNPKPF